MSSNQSSGVDSIADDPMDAVPTKGLIKPAHQLYSQQVIHVSISFFHILPDTPSQDLIQRLELAWTHNPLTALKLVSHLCGVRGTSKSDKQGFYAAALWLHEHHPKTLALNVRWFAESGYLKDLLEILYRILEGLDVRKVAKEERKDHVVYWKRGKRIERTEEVTIWKKGERVKVNKKICKNRSLSGTVKKGSEPLLKDWVNENMKNLTIEEKKQKGDKDRRS
ncbi:hypothetical protein IFM89_003605 [Coptis chinensis]|uniref:DUF2828 domain-containing protein n=1 Tax=Coptis chinensis TaxID=261450 RepID=A0A835LDB4_9MAGN|nr:hypothetical protein IFM89_003605 [Coptis chinensis]